MDAPSRRGDWWLWLGAVGALAVLAWRPTDHGDAWMYGATGRYVLDNASVPRTDPFSWTFHGAPWQSNGWGWGVVVDLAWRMGHFVGTSMLRPILVFAIAGAIVFAARTLGARRVPAMVASVVVVFALFPWLSERPHLASFAFFAAAIGVANRAAPDTRLRWRWLLLLFVTFIVWVNVHSVALQGVVVVGSMLAARGVEGACRTRSLRPLLAPAVAASVAVIATLCTPFGLSVFSYSREVRAASTATITEWSPLLRAGSGAVVPLAALLVLAIGTVWLSAWKRPACFVPLLVCAVFVFDAVRNEPYLVIGLAVFLTPLLPSRVPFALGARRDLARVGVLGGLAAAVIVSLPSLRALREPSPLTPHRAAAALPAGCRLRNDYRLGGWLIFHRPDVPVSADGRNDLYAAFGRDGYAQQRYFETSSGAAHAADDFATDGVTCVVATPDSPVVEALSGAGWATVAGDDAGVLLVAPGTSIPAPAPA